MLAAQKRRAPREGQAGDGQGRVADQNLYIQMREQKALDKVLESAVITEEEVGATAPAESSST